MIVILHIIPAFQLAYRAVVDGIEVIPSVEDGVYGGFEEGFRGGEDVE
jgi:hypothetical protein